MKLNYEIIFKILDSNFYPKFQTKLIYNVLTHEFSEIEYIYNF